MANIRKNILELIGNTPLVELSILKKNYELEATVLAKLESFNPGGSSKDRVGYNMIQEAEKSGKLKPGGTVVEPTSGNTGVGIALVAAVRGYRAIMVMPETMSIERRKLIAAYGAEIVLTDAAAGMAGSVEKARQLVDETPGAILAGQFSNPDNPASHYNTTGPEIWRDTDGKVDIFVAGIGTGGTLSGTGKFLREKNPEVEIIGIEPADSPLITEGKAGPHTLQGIGANFIPDTLDRDIYDRIVTVTGDQAMEGMREVARKEGIFVGVTSGAAVWTAVELAKDPANKGKNIVVLLPDTGERYLSIL